MRRTVTASVVALLVAIANGAQASSASPSSAPAAPTPSGGAPAPGGQIAVTVSSRRVGRPIRSGFLGLSFEFPAVRAYTGSDPRAINPLFVQLIRDLSPRQTPVLRIGGSSTDFTWRPLHHVKRSPGIKYTLTRRWLATTRALAAQTGARLILGVNLTMDSGAEVDAEGRAYRSGIGGRYIEALEIGNEPELYPRTPWYYSQPGNVPVDARPSTYNFAAYARDVANLRTHLPKSTVFAGPATNGYAYLRGLPTLFAAEPGLKIVTYHRYPLNRCYTKPGDPGYPTIPNLLSTVASRQLLPGAQRFIRLAHAHGATFRLDELNSVACSGQTGVSDTFASALWVLDSLFALAREGLDGVNIHTLPRAAYTLFSFRRSDRGWLARVNPEYYGLLMFTRAAPPGSRLLGVSTTPTPDVRARATLTPGGLIHVVLINDSLTTGHVAVVRPPRRARKALLGRLLAPSAAATRGVTLAGQSFGGETKTGTLAGKFRLEKLKAVHGRFRVTLGPASAAVLSIR